MPMSAPLPGMRFPKARMRKKQAPGMAGINQALSRKNMRPALTLQLVDLVQGDAGAVAEDQHDYGEADADFGGSDGDDEQGEDLPGDVVPVGTEGDEVEVDGVEHQLDGCQDEHGVASGQHAVDTDAEEHGGQEEELVQQHQSRLAMAMAPTSAARSRIETTSKGMM